MSIEDLLVIPTLLGAIYPIYKSLSPFVRNKIIFNIFDEIGNLKYKKIIISKLTFFAIYFIALIMFPLAYRISHIIRILAAIIIVSPIIIALVKTFYNYRNKKSKTDVKQDDKGTKIKILSYKARALTFHVYIVLFVYILLMSIVHLPYLAYFSVYFFFLYWTRYILEIFSSLYVVVFMCEHLFLTARQKKYESINDYLKSEDNKVWIEVLLKNGEKVCGELDNISNGLIQLNSKKTIYNINYKQIEVVGCKYYSSDE